MLRAIVQLSVRDGGPLEKALWWAESGEAEDLQAALLELNRLPALTQRHLLGRYVRHQTYKPKDTAKDGRKVPSKLLEGAG